MNTQVFQRWGGVAAVIAVLALGGYFSWQATRGNGLPPGFASGNGRIEAIEIDISAKQAGRISEILAREADVVQAGQVLVRMDTRTLDAELAQARAQVRRAESASRTALSVVRQRESARAAAEAVVAQRQSELAFAEKELQRAQTLVAKGFISAQRVDDNQAKVYGISAALDAARSQVLEAQSAISVAQSLVIEARAAHEAAGATVTRLQAEIEDATLKAPRSGRIEYRLAQPGEVVAAGGRILTLLDLQEVYMTFFLPEQAAGRAALGMEARIVLDAASDRPVPARISFVASAAQFTPKTVETQEERQKLMFRIKAQIEPALLARYQAHVKTGLPGVAYVRLDPAAVWPAHLSTDWARP